MTNQQEQAQSNPPKLKPVTFITGKYNYYGTNKFQEVALLKAMRITSDPKVLMKMTGMKKFADLTRTFDKLSNRKEYSSALHNLGMDFDWIAKGLKVEAEQGEKSADRIKAYQIILKSLGMDKYEDLSEGGGSWEDLILKASDKQEALPAPAVEAEADYEVVQPVIPKDMQEMRDRENKLGKSIYE